MLSDKTTLLSIAFFPHTLPFAFILELHVDASGVAGVDGAAEGAAVRLGGGGGAAMVMIG